MRKFYCLLILSCLSLPVQALETWITFQDENAVFTVEVPVAPVVNHYATKMDDGSEIATDTYSVERGEVAMMVMVGDLSGIKKDSTAIIEDTVAGAAEDKIIISKSNDELDGHKGLSAIFDDADGNRYMDRVFLVNGKLYQLLTVIFKNAAPEKRAEIDRFSHSLHFNK